MRLVYKYNIWRILVRIKGKQVVPSRKATKMLPRRERSGKERTRRQQPLYINARIQKTTVTFVY
jgi:hypothetical protein